jgi:hypothetical protein
MRIPFIPGVTRLAHGRSGAVLAAALLVACGLGGAVWSGATTAAGTAELPAAEASPRLDVKELWHLTGSYVVTGTDADGRPYPGSGILDIALAPSGALELEWDNGRQVGVGHLLGNVLAVASVVKGRTMILVMTINPDGSLSGRWSRRTDRGSKGTESWKKT